MQLTNYCYHFTSNRFGASRFCFKLFICRLELMKSLLAIELVKSLLAIELFESPFPTPEELELEASSVAYLQCRRWIYRPLDHQHYLYFPSEPLKGYFFAGDTSLKILYFYDRLSVKHL